MRRVVESAARCLGSLAMLAASLASGCGEPSASCDEGAARECIGPGACRGAQLCRDGSFDACRCDVSVEELDAEANANTLEARCRELLCGKLGPCLESQVEADADDDCDDLCANIALEVAPPCGAKADALFACWNSVIPNDFCAVRGPEEVWTQRVLVPCGEELAAIDACTDEFRADQPCCCCGNDTNTTVSSSPGSVTITTTSGMSCWPSTGAECSQLIEAALSGEPAARDAFTCDLDDSQGINGAAFEPRAACLAKIDRTLGHCNPTALGCDGLSVARCSSAGEWIPIEECAEHCALGRCQECVPGATRCRDGILESCSIDYHGGGWDPAGTCE